MEGGGAFDVDYCVVPAGGLGGDVVSGFVFGVVDDSDGSVPVHRSSWVDGEQVCVPET